MTYAIAHANGTTSNLKESSSRRQRGEAGSDTSSSFHAFLARQNKMGTDKLKHIEQIQVSLLAVVVVVVVVVAVVRL